MLGSSDIWEKCEGELRNRRLMGPPTITPKQAVASLKHPKP